MEDFRDMFGMIERLLLGNRAVVTNLPIQNLNHFAQYMYQCIELLRIKRNFYFKSYVNIERYIVVSVNVRPLVVVKDLNPRLPISSFIRSSMVHISISLTPASYYNHELYLSIISSTYSNAQFLLLLVKNTPDDLRFHF